MSDNPGSPGSKREPADENGCEAGNPIGPGYKISGLVVHGNHLGRTLGFPTANLSLEEDKPFPLPRGVYAVKVGTGSGRYNGMANAGIRPTVGGTTLTVEVNLFGFSGDLYGKTLEVDFIGRIRDERKFDSLDDLVSQLHRDMEAALKLLV
jgi:riboflavin kinase / FMN adenylyltransferase